MADRPRGLQRDLPLSRLTTIRAGESAELFARAGRVEQLDRVLDRADAPGIEVGVAGSGSNLLIADAGVRGLVVTLDKELAEIELAGTRIRRGGGVGLPAVSARAVRRVRDRCAIALEPEVQAVGPIAFPADRKRT